MLNRFPAMACGPASPGVAAEPGHRKMNDIREHA
jgi:hypothetical protein